MSFLLILWYFDLLDIFFKYFIFKNTTPPPTPLTTASECDNLGFSEQWITQMLPLNQEDSGPGFI